MIDKVRRFRHDLDWGANFWLFALSYLAWPPFAWKVSLKMPARLGVVRWSNLLTNYIYLAAGIAVLWFCSGAFANGEWFVATILVLTAMLHFTFFAVRMQIPYQMYRLERSDHHAPVA